MPKIFKLSQEIISKIAAAEIVTDPASVVKELIENSIDANAEQINILLKNSGLDSIVVVDNGEGMEKEDLEKCFESHTTSKIYNLKDLENVLTLGFRGEALHSISSVSKVSIKSQPKNTISGRFIEIHGGHLQAEGPVGIPQGTIVEVNDLFYNIPARKKFLKTPQIEFKKITDLIIKFALFHPQIGFALAHNENVMLHVPKNQAVEKRIEYLFGKSFADSLLQFSHDENYIKVFGFVSTPQFTYPSKGFQFVAVNKRPIKHKTLSNIIKDSYGTLIDHKSYPAYILTINLPTHFVDINVHPQKTVVDFFNEQEIMDVISKATHIVLANSNPIYKTDLLDRKSNVYLAQTLKETTPFWNIKSNSYKEKYDEVLQVNNLYLITELADGILIVDQHAAHERILYEGFLEQFNNKKEKFDTLSKNIVLDLPINMFSILEQNLKTLEKIGFVIKKQKNKFAIKAVPKIYEGHNIHILLLELLGDLEKNVNKKEIADRKSLKTISYLACRSAIKSGDYLTLDERRNLLKKLDTTKTNYTCPHGRPAKVLVGWNELARSFKRG